MVNFLVETWSDNWNKMEFLRALKPTKIFLGLLYPTVFSLRVDFHCRVIFTCVKFTFASKIEAINA